MSPITSHDSIHDLKQQTQTKCTMIYEFPLVAIGKSEVRLGEDLLLTIFHYNQELHLCLQWR